MNQELPLVSVCIPTFQHASSIATCLDSVLSQHTTFPIEIILGEDDSTDGTREICQSYAADYPDLIRLFLRKNEDKIHILGRKSGRANYLENFKAARGKYIAMLDGDDSWLTPDKLQKQVELLEKYPMAILCTTDYFSGKNKPASNPSDSSQQGLNSFFSKDQIKRISYSGHVSNWVFRNEIADFLSSPAAKKAPILDLILFAYLKEKGGFVHINEQTSFYRINDQSYHFQKAAKSNYSELFWSNWYQFIYFHKKPSRFLHYLGFLGKKIIRRQKAR